MVFDWPKMNPMISEVAMKNSRWFLLVLAGALLCVPSLAKEKKVIESKWTAAPVQIDGAEADWPQDALELEKDVKVTYAFKNDAGRIYVLFVLNDPAFISTIESTGLGLWVNSEGKEKRNYGLRCHRRMTSGDQLIQQMESQGQILTEEKKQEIKAKPGFMLFLCDRINKKGEVIPQPGANQGTYRVGRVQGRVVYEIGFPLAFLEDPASQAKWDPAKPIEIGFEWGGLTEEMKKARAEQASEMAGAGGGGGGGEEGEGGGGGSRGGGMSMGGGRRTPLKYDFWVDVKIAQNQ